MLYAELSGLTRRDRLLIDVLLRTQRQVEALGADPRYSVLVFDNRGSGSSDTPVRHIKARLDGPNLLGMLMQSA